MERDDDVTLLKLLRKASILDGHPEVDGGWLAERIGTRMPIDPG